MLYLVSGGGSGGGLSGSSSSSMVCMMMSMVMMMAPGSISVLGHVLVGDHVGGVQVVDRG